VLMAAIYDRPVHIAHISLREEILIIKAARGGAASRSPAKSRRINLFLTEDDS